jgi:hypothetical protein
MGRDHAIQCEECGDWYGGFNGPDECPCRWQLSDSELKAVDAFVEQLVARGLMMASSTEIQVIRRLVIDYRKRKTAR